MLIRGVSKPMLLVVVMVLATTAGLAFPHFLGLLEERTLARAGVDCRVLQATVEAYYVSHGKRYPPTGPAWQQALKTSRLDLFSHSHAPYQFVTSPTGLFYIIWSVGRDGAATITGIDDAGRLTGSPGDDLYVSNGIVRSGGF